MPTQGLLVERVNFDELAQAFGDTPALTTKFVKTELFRFARRVRRRLIQERMSGRPGIEGGQFKRGKHVQGFTVGDDLASLKAVNKISRILRVHEVGGVIQGPVAIRLKKGLPSDPRKVPGLFKLPNIPALAVKEGQGIRILYMLRRGVRIPARLGFEGIWRRELPDGQQRVLNAAERAMRVAMEQRLKTVSGFIQRAVA